MKCDNCANKGICKHVDYMQNIEDQLLGVLIDKNISIRVEVKCGYQRELNCCGGNINSSINNPFIKKDIYSKPQITYCE